MSPTKCLVGLSGLGAAAPQPRKVVVISRKADQGATAAGNGGRPSRRGHTSPPSRCPASGAAPPLPPLGLDLGLSPRPRRAPTAGHQPRAGSLPAPRRGRQAQPAVPENLLDHVGLMSLDLPAGRQVKAMILSSAPHRGEQSGSASYTCLMSAAQPLRASRAVVGRAGMPAPALAGAGRWARWPRVLPACRSLGAGRFEYHP